MWTNSLKAEDSAVGMTSLSTHSAYVQFWPYHYVSRVSRIMSAFFRASASAAFSAAAFSLLCSSECLLHSCGPAFAPASRRAPSAAECRFAIGVRIQLSARSIVHSLVATRDALTARSESSPVFAHDPVSLDGIDVVFGEHGRCD